MKVSELDPGRIPEGPARDFVTSRPDGLSKFTHASREDVEAAKGGYDSRLKAALMPPAKVMLMRLGGRKCSEREFCLSWMSGHCTSSGRPAGRGKVELMACWSACGEPGEAAVMGAVIRACHDGRTVLIIV